LFFIKISENRFDFGLFFSRSYARCVDVCVNIAQMTQNSTRKMLTLI